MKYVGFPLVILFFCMGIALFPQKGSAALTAMNEAQMRDTTGQYGIALSAFEKVGLDAEIGHVAFGDRDVYRAFLSLNDISMIGVITAAEPVSTTVTTGPNPFDDSINTGVDVKINDVSIAIDHYKINSITVGPEIAIGNSFGGFTISDYHARISGNLRIWTQ